MGWNREGRAGSGIRSSENGIKILGIEWIYSKGLGMNLGQVGSGDRSSSAVLHGV